MNLNLEAGTWVSLGLGVVGVKVSSQVNRVDGMLDQNITNSSPALEPAPEPSVRPKRTTTMRISQDEMPRHALDRRQPRRQEVALERARLCARIASDNRAKDILVLDLRKATPLIDFFVIATASARRQSRAMASEIDHEMKKIGEAKLGMEGFEDGRWTLIDYGDFVVHIFTAEDRAYYALEEIWGDSPQIDWREPAIGRGPAIEDATAADLGPGGDVATS